MVDGAWVPDLTSLFKSTLDWFSIDDANVNGNARKTMVVINDNYFCTWKCRNEAFSINLGCESYNFLVLSTTGTQRRNFRSFLSGRIIALRYTIHMIIVLHDKNFSFHAKITIAGCWQLIILRRCRQRSRRPCSGLYDWDTTRALAQTAQPWKSRCFFFTNFCLSLSFL